MVGIVSGTNLLCMHGSDSLDAATRKCALAVEDTKVCLISLLNNNNAGGWDASHSFLVVAVLR